MGTFVGFVYGSRFLISGTLWEPIVLHIVNNLVSSLMPIQANLELTDPWIFLPCKNFYNEYFLIRFFQCYKQLLSIQYFYIFVRRILMVLFKNQS